MFLSRPVYRAGIFAALANILLMQPASAVDSFPKESHSSDTAEECDADAYTSAEDLLSDKANHYQTLLLNVVINENNLRETIAVLSNPCGGLFVLEEDLRRWRVKTEQFYAAAIAGEYYLSLKDIPGLTFGLNKKTQTLYLDFVPEIFRAVRINFRPPARAIIAPSTAGASISYGLSVASDNPLDGSSSSGSVLLRGFGKFGTVSSNWGVFDPTSSQRFSVRQNTTYTHDFYGPLAQFRAGDFFTSGSVGGSGYRLAGIQIRRNFAINPAFSLTPTTEMSASTARPVRVDLGINALGSDPFSGTPTQSLFTYPGYFQYGPLELYNIPLAANGRYDLTLKDRNGNTQVVSQDNFYTSGILRQGVFDYSLSAGFSRVSENTYREFVAFGSWRYGISSHVSTDGHIEHARGSSALGLGLRFTIPYLGAGRLRTTFADYNGDTLDLNGNRIRLSITNRYRKAGYAVSYEKFDRDFRLPFQAEATEPLASIGSVGMNFRPHRRLTVQLSYSQAEPRNDLRREAVSLSLSPRIAGGGNFGFSVNRELRPETRVNYTLQYTMPIDQIRRALGFEQSSRRPPLRGESVRRSFNPGSVSFAASKEESNDLVANASISGNGKIGDGRYTTSLSTGLSDGSGQTARVSYRNNYFTSNLSTRYNDGSYNNTLSFSSGFVWLKEPNKVFITTAPVGSYALVRLGSDLANVRVSGRYTDDDGDVLLPGLSPYSYSSFRLNSNDLPTGTVSNNADLGVRIGFENATLFDYSVPVYRDVLLTITIEGGSRPLPIGAIVTVDGRSEEHPVGNDGLIYIPRIEDGSAIRIEWKEQVCSFAVELPDARVDKDFDIPELGPYDCTDMRY